MVFIIYNINCTINTIISIFCKRDDQYSGACAGGAKGLGPPPIEKQKKTNKKKQKTKKRASEQILSYFTYILLLFQSKMSFSQLVSELGPPPEKVKSKKKKNK